MSNPIGLAERASGTALLSNGRTYGVNSVPDFSGSNSDQYSTLSALMKSAGLKPLANTSAGRASMIDKLDTARIAGNSAVLEANNNAAQESSMLGDTWNGVKSMGRSLGEKFDNATLGETLKGVSDIGGLGLGYMSYLANRTALANQNRINNENLVMAKDQLYGAVDDTTGKRSKYTINQQVANSLKAGFR